jgi:acetyl esterase
MVRSVEAEDVPLTKTDDRTRGSWKLLRRAFQFLLPALSLAFALTSMATTMPGIDPRAGIHAWIVRRFGRSRGYAPEELRKPSLLSLFLLEGPSSPSVAATDLSIVGPVVELPARLYRPKSTNAPRLPLLIYLHFGGGVLGDLDTSHTVCSLIAEHAHCLVLSVGYRLAPEHRFPAALDDVLTAFDWVRLHSAHLGADADRIAIGGDSAGGHLSAAATMSLRDHGANMPCAQLLIYPVVDMDRRAMPPTAFDEIYPLTRSDMIWFAEQYMHDNRDAQDPRCSIGRAESLAGLPPTILVHAGCDVLRGEGLDFGKRLRAEGNAVTTLDYPSLPHAFTAMSGGVPRAREAIIEIAHTLATHMHSKLT